jgi:hypothetical protein
MTKQLNKVERPFTVFVEPQDFKAYPDAGCVSIVQLPENNRGIAYARQLIVKYATGHDNSWFWMLDDDIYSFAVKVKKGDIIKDDASLLERVEYSEFEVHDWKNPAFPDNLAAVKLSHQNLMEQSVNSPMHKRGYVLNTCVNICCMFNAKLITAIDYCLELSVLEDVDYCLQLLSKGRQTLRFLNYAFQVPASKSNPGGCSEVWKEESRTKSNELMIERWGNCLRPWNDHSKNVEVRWTSIQAAIRKRL